MTQEAVKVIREALEISMGYTALVANGIGNMPILKARAQSDCAILEGALEALDSIAGGWREIETAPRDGTVILGADFERGYRGLVLYQPPEWHMVNLSCDKTIGMGFYPTHWMPLPEPPKGETE